MFVVSFWSKRCILSTTGYIFRTGSILAKKESIVLESFAKKVDYTANYCAQLYSFLFAMLLPKMVRYMIYLSHCFFSWTINKNVVLNPGMNASSFFQWYHFVRSKGDRKDDGRSIACKIHSSSLFHFVSFLFHFVSSLLSFPVARDRWEISRDASVSNAFFYILFIWRNCHRKS